MNEVDYGWYYPAGTNTADYSLAGVDYEEESEVPCPQCAGWMVEQGYNGNSWLVCSNNHVVELERND